MLRNLPQPRNKRQAEMMNDECGMMNEKQPVFRSSFRIHRSSFPSCVLSLVA
jgi:hypothetical protein